MSLNEITPSTGGSSRLKPHRDRQSRQTVEEKNQSAKVRAIEKYGAIFISGLQQHWSFLDTDDNEAEIADGIIMGLIVMGMSNIEIRNTIKIGGHRLQRLRNRIKLGEDYIPPVHRRAHQAFNEATLEFLFSIMESWRERLEDGFPCPHRRIKSYFFEAGITWKKLHDEYQQQWELLGPELKSKISKMAYSTFTQYVHWKNPGLRLTRSKQDECDSCIRLNIILDDPEATEDEKNQA
jgi:hypothetical protein